VGTSRSGQRWIVAVSRDAGCILADWDPRHRLLNNR